MRLAPGADVRRELLEIAKQEKISAGTVLSAVGSLSHVYLRFADAKTPTKLPGKHEVLTLSGTIGVDGVHLHMMVANQQGECKGGHLVEGCLVYTTLELVIALMPEVRFRRQVDPDTGFRELDISTNL
ncbi:PPC domain-containing DNA-binding protein [Acaryochloris thomasi]|uniref:PPC domain-containing DNA-binding protein n=1 Tax=Acaryochloris thomasi TaxID=2929456 RepID=UPI001F3A27E7|nr:PPC domain-containing DNA-binding protein [Acaryochloris thomasi]